MIPGNICHVCKKKKKYLIDDGDKGFICPKCKDKSKRHKKRKGKKKKNKKTKLN